jgi:hypothetical protein
MHVMITKRRNASRITWCGEPRRCDTTRRAYALEFFCYNIFSVNIIYINNINNIFLRYCSSLPHDKKKKTIYIYRKKKHINIFSEKYKNEVVK